MSLSVRDESANRELMITNAVSVIGRSEKKFMFFKVMYDGKKLVKPQEFIRDKGNFSSTKQVLTIGKKFVAEKIVKQVKDDSNKTAYEKIDFYTHNKNTIISRVKKNTSSSSGIRYIYTGNSVQRSKSHSRKKNNTLKKWDVFISHAHQDKTIAEPFVKKLKEMNVKVWYDKDILRWGDSLMDSINKGLKDSLYGVVILSKTFFKKHWTKTELRALLSLSNATGRKKILPLFYKITHEEIVEEYPILADIVGRSWDDGLDNLVTEIKEIIERKKGTPTAKPKPVEKKVTDPPIIQIVNFGVEPPNPSNPQKTNYHPNLRNDGNVPVNNIRMYYKVMHRVVDLDDIVREKDEIRRQYIPYEGSIFPNGSARVNPIILEKTDKEVSVVFWIDYDYGENESSEIIFNIQFQNFKNTRVIPYDHSVISKAERKWFDIKSGKGGAPI